MNKDGASRKGTRMTTTKAVAKKAETGVSEGAMARATAGTLADGQALVKVGGAYQTAMMVQVKRDIGTVADPGGTVLQRSMVEAKLMGDRFFYGWSVNDKRSGGKVEIEGISVDGAHMLLRNWTNAVCDIDVVSVDEAAYTFKATFVDLESGATCSRLYRQRRAPAPGNYDQQRWDDMQFSNGQSRAIRNVICAALPQWLQDRCMEVAQQSGGSETHRGGGLAEAPQRRGDPALFQRFTTLLKQAWGKDALQQVVSEIKLEEARLSPSEVSGLRSLYRLLAASESVSTESVGYVPDAESEGYVPDAEFEEGSAE